MKIKLSVMSCMFISLFYMNAAYAKQDFSAIDRFVIQAKKNIGLQPGTTIRNHYSDDLKVKLLDSGKFKFILGNLFDVVGGTNKPDAS